MIRNHQFIRNSISTLMSAILFTLILSGNVSAQYHTQELPGMVSTTELLTYTGIAVTGLVVGKLAIKVPDKREVDFSKLTLDQIEDALNNYTGPCVVEMRRPFKTKYGTIHGVQGSSLVLETETDSVLIPLNDIKKVKDLRTEAARKSAGRKRWGIFSLGMATAGLYWSGTGDGSSGTLGMLEFFGFGALSAYSFAKQSREETESHKWTQPTRSEATRRLLNPEFDLAFVPASSSNQSIETRLLLRWRF